MRSAFQSPLQTGSLGFSRHNVDDAPKRIIAIQGRTATAHDLNALNALQRHLTPVDPTSERVVQRDPVQQDERPADATWSNPAQGNALSGWICRHAAAAPEQAKARDLT